MRRPEPGGAAAEMAGSNKEAQRRSRRNLYHRHCHWGRYCCCKVGALPLEYTVVLS